MSEKKKVREDAGIEVIDSEVADQDAIPATYKVVTYPADYTLKDWLGNSRKV